MLDGHASGCWLSDLGACMPYIRRKKDELVFCVLISVLSIKYLVLEKVLYFKSVHLKIQQGNMSTEFSTRYLKTYFISIMLLSQKCLSLTKNEAKVTRHSEY